MHGQLFQFWHIASNFSFPPCEQMFVCFKFRTAFQGKIHPDGHQTKGGVSDFSKRFSEPKKLFSTVFFTDDAFSAIAHHIDGISCFC